MLKRLLVLACLVLTAACSTTRKDAAVAPSTSSSGYVTVNGIEMYYESHGSGQPLVLLHGGGSSIHVSFGRGIPLLARHYRVIAFDEQNHGRTKAYDRELTFEQTADDIAAALKKLGIENAYFLGFSNGATTGMQIAIRHPGVLKKMVLGSGLYRRDGAPPQFWKFINMGTLASMPPELKDEYVKVAPSPGDLPKMFEGDSKRMRGFKDIPNAAIKKVDIPVLIMQNDRDVATPEHAAKIARLLPQGSLAILPGGHDNYLGNVSVKNNTLTEVSVSIIREFLK